VVNIMSDWYVESANHCCGAFSADIDEMEIAGLTKLSSERIKPPRVGEAAVQLECEVLLIFFYLCEYYMIFMIYYLFFF
jgi:flavin reductase (DIM6/NTAB) family NADH-FMN oxidoreductase RutF